MEQVAPTPDALVDLVRRATFKRGWTFKIGDVERGQGCAGLTLTINVHGPHSYDHGRMVSVDHLFIVPAAAYREADWRRWLFDRVLDVERHEAMEFFEIDGVKPYAPNHGPGCDPYTVRELATDTERRTSFRGVVNP